MITIVETVTYQRRAAKVLKPDEAEAALLLIASHPAIGDCSSTQAEFVKSVSLHPAEARAAARA